MKKLSSCATITAVYVAIVATLSFLATPANAQCYPAPVYYTQPVYTVPVYTYPAPIYTAPTPRTVISQPDYHNIRYGGTIRSKEYVSACLPSGKRITVPVINGIAPEINRSSSGGSEVYDFTYDEDNKWDGKSPIVYAETKKQAPRVSETIESIHDYKGKKIGISEWTERAPSITETRTPHPKVGEETVPAKIPAPSFQDEVKKLQDLYEQRQRLKDEEYAAAQKRKSDEYAAAQKLKDQEYLDTIEKLRASMAELKEMVQKMEKAPPIVSPPPKVETAPPPRIAPGMKKPSEIENPKGSE